MARLQCAVEGRLRGRRAGRTGRASECMAGAGRCLQDFFWLRSVTRRRPPRRAAALLRGLGPDRLERPVHRAATRVAFVCRPAADRRRVGAPGAVHLDAAPIVCAGRMRGKRYFRTGWCNFVINLSRIETGPVARPLAPDRSR